MKKDKAATNILGHLAGSQEFVARCREKRKYIKWLKLTNKT